MAVTAAFFSSPGAGVNMIDRASGTIVTAGRVNTLKEADLLVFMHQLTARTARFPVVIVSCCFVPEGPDGRA